VRAATASTTATAAAVAPRARAGHAVAYEGFVLGLRFEVVMLLLLGLGLRLLGGVGAARGSGFLYRKHGSKSENPNASKQGLRALT